MIWRKEDMGERSEERFTWFPKLTATCAKVPEEHRGKLLWALVVYGTTGEEPTLDWPLDAIFEGLRDDIDNSKRSMRAGERGGRARRRPKADVEEGASSEGGSSEEAEAPYDEGAKGGSEEAEAPYDEGAKGGSEEAEAPYDEETKGGSEEAEAIPYQTIPNHTKPKRREGARERRAFTAPSAEEVEAYCRAHEPPLRVDAARFVDYFEAQGWRLSNGNRMRDWRAAARNWSNRERPRSGQMVTGGEVDAKYAML